MRLRLLCLAIAVGVGVFAFLRKPERTVAVTYLRSESVGTDSTRMVFALRNDTGHPVTFLGCVGGTTPNSPGSLEIPPHSTMEAPTVWKNVDLPRVLYSYIVPWTFAENRAAEKRYARYPKPLRTWFMRKYDSQRPAYRHELQLP